MFYEKYTHLKNLIKTFGIYSLITEFIYKKATGNIKQ